MRAVHLTSALILFVAVGACAADWPVVYETDFSTDPNWIDDDVAYRERFPYEPPPSEDHFWKQDQGNCFVRSRNWTGNPPDPYDHPNRFSYTPVPWTGKSFELTMFNEPCCR